MTSTQEAIERVRGAIAAPNGVLTEARERRDATLDAAAEYHGVRRSYRCGSLESRFENRPVEDADCGIVLDRRTHREIGPDGDGKSPIAVVEELQEIIGPVLRERWPNTRGRKMRRGLRFHLGAPLADGHDPYVDLVVAMERRDDPGLWIPDLNVPSWSPSHPERHIELFASGTEAERRTRRRTARLAKAWNKQYSQPGLSSFNIAALALEADLGAATEARALLAWFDHAAEALSERRTADPAGVSGAIKLLVLKGTIVQRLERARDHLRNALEHDDDPDVVGEELGRVFWCYKEVLPSVASRPTWRGAASLDAVRVSAVGLTLGSGRPLKSQRAFGTRRG